MKKTSWEDMYNLAKDYYLEYGNLLISTRFRINGINLGTWISRQRQAYRNNKLSIGKIEKLESIGMVWETYKLSWDDFFNFVKEYYIKHRDLLMPTNYEINGVKLGAWIIRQRQAYRNNKLNIQQIEKLESIGMIWEANKYNKIYMLIDDFMKYDKEKLLSAICEVINTYEMDAISNFLNKTDVNSIIEDLKNKLDKDSYSMLILHLLDVDIEKISNIFNINVNEIELIRLKGMKIILENCLEKDSKKNIKIKS